jgi:hypothetical protein
MTKIYVEWQGMAGNHNKLQGMTRNGRMNSSDKKWQGMARKDKECQRMARDDKE